MPFINNLKQAVENKKTRLKVMCTSAGGRGAEYLPGSVKFLSDEQLDTLRNIF